MLSKDLSQTKKKEEEGSEKKEIKGMKLNRSVLNGCRLVLGCFRLIFKVLLG